MLIHLPSLNYELLAFQNQRHLNLLCFHLETYSSFVLFIDKTTFLWGVFALTCSINNRVHNAFGMLSVLRCHLFLTQPLPERQIQREREMHYSISDRNFTNILSIFTAVEVKSYDLKSTENTEVILAFKEKLMLQ